MARRIFIVFLLMSIILLGCTNKEQTIENTPIDKSKEAVEEEKSVDESSKKEMDQEEERVIEGSKEEMDQVEKSVNESSKEEMDQEEESVNEGSEEETDQEESINESSKETNLEENKHDESNKEQPSNENNKEENEDGDIAETYPQLTKELLPGERLVKVYTSKGYIKIKLFPELAPKTVKNFITHAQNGYYEGQIFHRVINEFMIQGGDPTGTGMGGESIYGEKFADEFTLRLFNLRGALSMANSGADTNGSQFFIVQAGPLSADLRGKMEVSGFPNPIIDYYLEHGGTPWLDQRHTVFGQVVEGMEIVDTIASLAVDKNNRPTEPVVIKSIEVLH